MLTHPDGTIWTPDNKVRGALSEELLGRDTRGVGLHNNEPVIDVFDAKTGQAISMKTLDWNTPTRIAKPEVIESLIKRQVNELINYEGTKGLVGNSERAIALADIHSKVLELILPASGGTPAQIAAVNRAIAYATANGIKVVVIKAK